MGQLGKLENHLQGCGYVKVKCSLSAYIFCSPSSFPPSQKKMSSSALYTLSHMSQSSLVPYNVQSSEKQVKCGEEMERRYLDSHMRECKYRQFVCEYCGYVDTYDAIAGSGEVRNLDSKVKGPSNNHYRECDDYPLKCTNNCSEGNIKRKHMKPHRDVCPLEVLKCPYCAEDGILRRNLESHKSDCDFRPFSCKYCNEVGTFLTITGKGRLNTPEVPSHYDKCGHYPLKCVNKCGEESIIRKGMINHRRSCPCEPLDCPLGKHVSRRKILRKDMEYHKSEECEFRPYTCHYCRNHTGTYKSVTGKGETPLKGKPHYHVCEHYPLDCPNKCGGKSVKSKMPSHRDVCPLEKIECPFKYAKCAAIVLRQDMDSHCQNNMQQHLLLMAQSQQELARKNDEMLQRNRELASKNSDLAQTNKELTRKINEVTRENKELARKNDSICSKNEDLAKSYGKLMRQQSELNRKVEQLIARDRQRHF